MMKVTLACALSRQWQRAYETTLTKQAELVRAQGMLKRVNLSEEVRQALGETVEEIQADLDNLRSKVVPIEMRCSDDIGQRINEADPSLSCIICGKPVYPCRNVGKYIHLECLGRLK